MVNVHRGLNLLGQAVDRGLVIATSLENLWPAMKLLAGNPEFKAIQARMFERSNAERAELGLGPLSI